MERDSRSVSRKDLMPLDRLRIPRRFPRLRLSLAVSLLLIPVLAFALTALALWCQPNEFADIVARFTEKPVLIALNVLPVGLVLLCASCLSGNLFYGAAVTDLVVCGLSVANRIKIQVRDEPVFPRDFALLKEVGSAMESYEIDFPGEILAAVGLAALAGILLGLFLDSFPRLRNWRWRLGLFAVSAAALGLLITRVLGSNDLYDSLGASNPYRLSVVFNENGFPYNFCHQFTTYQVDRPAGYSRARAEAWDKEDTGYHADVLSGDGEGKRVSVIMVMDEAFSDITDDPAFAFSPEDDPLPNLHAVAADPHGTVLRLVVPGFAGGTANTEFDVLTGMQTNALGAATTSAMRTVNRNLDSLFRVFGTEGYHTSFFHPGDDWFYNRENVYRWLGAEETRFIDEMPDPEYKGRWVTDDYLASLIEEAFTDAAEAGTPLFHYATTIQNHMGYPWNKYGEGYAFPPVSFAEGVAVSDGIRSMLEVYIEGARDADAMLGRLRDFLALREEPAVLVFFGDHLPYLGDDRLAYQALGMDIAKEDEEREDYFSIYETPCAVWANDAAAEVLDWDSAMEALDLPENGKLSACFLGAAILDLTGRGRATAWTAFLNDLRRELPVVQRNIRMLPDGTVVDSAGGANQEAVGTESGLHFAALEAKIQKWRQWSYYKLEQKEIKSVGTDP